MKLLIYWNELKEVLTGQAWKATLDRNTEAVDRLDRAVKEVLGK